MKKKNSSVPKLRWEECYAKLVLESAFPERFSQLTIADKPDLQNRTANIGIEVTTAISKNEKEKDHLFSLLVNNKGTSYQRNRSKDRIKQLGGEYDDKGIMLSRIGFRELNGVYSAFEGKLTKLNSGGYIPFEKQFIFITDTNMIKTNELKEVHSELNKRQEQFSKKFDLVFLYLYGGHLIEFDMNSGENHSYSIDNNSDLADKAFRMVKGDMSCCMK